MSRDHHYWVLGPGSFFPNGVGDLVLTWGFTATFYQLHLLPPCSLHNLQRSKNTIIGFQLSNLPYHFSSTFLRFYAGDYKNVWGIFKIVSFRFTYNNCIYSQRMQLMPVKFGFKSELGNPTLIDWKVLNYFFISWKELYYLKNK